MKQIIFLPKMRQYEQFIFFLKHITLPILGGVIIYALWRGIHFIDKTESYFPLFNATKIPNWIKFNLPDGLWFYAFLSTILFIWREKISMNFFLWLLLAIIISLFLEISQEYQIINGTFDWYDLLAYFIATILCIINFKKQILIFKLKKIMKTKQNLYSLMTLLLFAFLFWASATPKSVERIYSKKVTYEKVDKDTKSTPFETSYALPVFKLIGNTTQNQTVGGITILCEVNSFHAERKTKEEKELFFADPNKPGYDIYKVTKTPFFEISPSQVVFTIKIINNLDFPIELSNVPIIFKMDGIGVSISPEFNIKWKSSIAAGGETTIFSIPGPTKEELENAKNVILQIQNIPTVYDNVNGKLMNFETFKWLFEIAKEPVVKQETKEYSYIETPTYKETCSNCSGSGKIRQQEQCTKCQGTKQLKYTDYKTGKSWVGNCDKCNGSGYLIANVNCSRCSGTGQIEYPKSQLPKVASNVTWNGWRVNIITKPAGAGVNIVDPNTGQYFYAGASNGQVNWFSSNTSTSETFPIIIEYSGKKYKIFPYDKKGNPSPEIIVNFLSEDGPKIKGGNFTN